MQVVCGVESCGLCYEESLSLPPPWACDVCRLVNWPLGDGAARLQCRGCGYVRGSFEAEDLAMEQALTERQAFVDRVERLHRLTYQEFLDADPWEE